MNGAIVGVGVTRGFSAVRWDIVRDIMLTWVTTIPVAVLVSFAAYQVLHLLGFG
jgi:PiT family inorganic phosphate transporter